MLAVARVAAGSAAAGVLKEGDLLLAVNGETLNRFREVERATQAPRVRLTVLRDGAEQALEVDTAPLLGEDIDRMLLWSGAVIHAPHRAMAIQRAIPPEGVFVAYFSYGSPATRHGLYAGRRIVEVDGKPTPDLDAFIAAIQGRRGPLVGASQDGDLERHDRRDDAEARPELLADVRTAPHADGLGASSDFVSTEEPSKSEVPDCADIGVCV